MRKLTDEKLSQDILNNINIEEVEKFGGNKDKIVRKLNEFYQYDPKTFSTTNKGDFTLLKKFLNSYVYELKYF